MPCVARAASKKEAICDTRLYTDLTRLINDKVG